MKKTLLTFLVGFLAVCGFAQKTFTDQLVVTINGESTEPMPAEIVVERADDGTYNLSLKNFILVAGEDMMPVGNISLTGITMTIEKGVSVFETQQKILITAGDESQGMWMGPMLGEVPIDLKGKLKGDQLYCNIDIDMVSVLGQVINVVFGKDIEIPEGPAVLFTKVYKDQLVVTINGQSTPPMDAEISMDVLEDGNYNLSLNNFILVAGEDMMPVGNIKLTGIHMQADPSGAYRNFETQQNILITAGDESQGMWMGPMLGEVPIDMKGKMTNDQLYCNIGIDMSQTLGQTINVVFGKDIKAPEVEPDVIFTYTFKDKLVVNVNGMTTDSIPATITADVLADGTYKLSLLNFMMVAGEDVLPIGNIVLKGIVPTQDKVEPYKNFATQQTIQITPGDESQSMWMGPMLGEVPIDMKGKLSSDRLYCVIDIDMTASLNQVIKVVFGQDFIPTAIDRLTQAAGAVDVYTLSGVRVRHQVTVNGALQGLPKGIYVVNGKKILVK